LDQRLSDDLDAAVEELRKSALDLFGVDLHVLPALPTLAPNRAFHFAPRDVAWTSIGSLHRHGRRKIQQHLRDQLDPTISKHVGRARADLQDRLRETTRQFLSTLRSRFDEHAEHLQDALAGADNLNRLTTAEVAVLREQLETQRSTLEALIHDLADTRRLR
jgi:hypothetical protein